MQIPLPLTHSQTYFNYCFPVFSLIWQVLTKIQKGINQQNHGRIQSFLEAPFFEMVIFPCIHHGYLHVSRVRVFKVSYLLKTCSGESNAYHYHHTLHSNKT